MEPNRLLIINQIQKFGEITPSEIEQYVEISLPAISQHLKILKEIKLVTVKKDGTSLRYSINPIYLDKLNKIWTTTIAGGFIIPSKKQKQVQQ